MTGWAGDNVYLAYKMTRVCCNVAGEQVLCFHGPLLYEAKVCSRKHNLQNSK